MKLRKRLNQTWVLIFSIFLFANIAQANNHEESIDGEGNLPEVEQHREAHKEMRMQKRDRKGHRRAMRAHDRLDTNEDGKVDLNEFLSHAESRFNEMDTDSDQFVTEEEAKQHHKNMRKKLHGMRKNQKHKDKAGIDTDK